MATLGESVGGLIGNFSFIFIFLLVFAVVFGLLSYINPFKDERKGIYGIMAFVIAILVTITSTAVQVIKNLTVWFFVFGLAAFFIIFIFGVFGLKEKEWLGAMTKGSGYVWVIIISVIIILFALSSAFGQRLLEKQPGTTTGTGTSATGTTVTGEPTGGSVEQGNSFADNVLQTLINPKVLGLLMVLFVGVFTIVFMTRS